MEKQLRSAIGSAAQNMRRLLEQEFLQQLEGMFDVHANGVVAEQPGAHLSSGEVLTRAKIVAALQYRRAGGASGAEAVATFVREAAFTTLNRFVALKMLEARTLVQECVSAGADSIGYREFIGLAEGIALLPTRTGYRLYIESLFDELATEVQVLFDRTDTSSLLWPRDLALDALLAELNKPELATVWDDEETIGWFYQFFNSKEERQQMRDESQAPRNSRELAVRNQFFTPRYVVQFLVDNTLGRTWAEMVEKSAIKEHCKYFVELPDARPARELRDPRDLRVLDPACGSGHFLLYSFDLLAHMYREAWEFDLGVDGDEGSHSLREAFGSGEELDRALPGLILEHNLHGVDIDPRAAQIAALALWLRAQRAWQEAGLAHDQRPSIRRTNIVVAELMPGDEELVSEFVHMLHPPLLGALFRTMIGALGLAGEMGTLLRPERDLQDAIMKAREEFIAEQLKPPTLPGLDVATDDQGQLDLSGITDDAFFLEAERLLLDALRDYAVAVVGGEASGRRMFADDSAQGVAFIELLRHRYDVVLMNPPFGAGSLKAKKAFEASYPRTKNDVYAAFVERGIELLHPGGMLGAITSRTGFFLSSFQKWREEIILAQAPPLVFADLGQGVLDGAMVEVAAYCLVRNLELLDGAS